MRVGSGTVNPDAGQLFTIKSLGVDIETICGCDYSERARVIYVALRTSVTSSECELYRINPVNSATAQLLGETLKFIALSTPSTERVRPTISIISPSAGSLPDRNVTLTGGASDNVFIDNVYVRIRQPGRDRFSRFRLATGTTSWSYSFVLKRGTTRVQARAVDASGNKSRVARVTYRFR